MQHFFDIDIATKYNVNAAIFLNNVAHWIHKNVANKKHIYEGRCWTYNSVKAFQELFPYFSTKTVRTTINYCLKNKLLVKGNFNKVGYDRTTWYALTDKGLSLFPTIEALSQTICPNRQMDLPKVANGFAANGKPIPNNKPDKKQIKNKRASRSVRFTKFPDQYFPDNETMEVLTHNALRTKNTEHELFEKFETVSKKYKTKSNNWHQTFKEFLEREKPKKTYENAKGQVKRYVDDAS